MIRSILVGLIVYALISAYFAIRRIVDKRRINLRALQVDSTQAAESSGFGNSTTAARSSNAASNAASSTSPLLAHPIAIVPDGETAIVMPTLLEPVADLPLASSVSVSEAVRSEAIDAPFIQDFVPNHLAIPEVDQEIDQPAHEEHSGFLEEIAQLREGQEDPISHFLQYLDHPDRAIRLAAIFELGELASRHSHRAEEVMQRLDALSQDEDPNVRAQALEALGKL